MFVYVDDQPIDTMEWIVRILRIPLFIQTDLILHHWGFRVVLIKCLACAICTTITYDYAFDD